MKFITPQEKKRLKDFVIVYKKQLQPFPVLLVCPGYYVFCKKYFNRKMKNLYILMDDGMWSANIDVNEWSEMKQVMMQWYRKDPKVIDKFMQQFKKPARDYLRFTSSLMIMDLSKLSDEDLAHVYKKYYDEYLSSFIYSEPAPNMLKDAIEDELKEKLLKFVKNKNELNNIFSLLTIPSTILGNLYFDPFTTREEKDLLKIAVLAKKKGITALKSRLEKHASIYSWVPVDYNGKPWTLKDFEKRIKDILNEKISLKDKLRAIDKNPINLEKKQLEIKNKHNIDDQTFEDCITAQKCMVHMDFKKEVYSKTHLHVRPLMAEIGKRLGLTLTQANFLTREEVLEALISKAAEERDNKKSMDEKYNKKLMDARYKQSAYCAHDLTATFLDKDEEKILREMIEKKPEKGNENQLEGICGNPGIIKAKARVILETKDFSKMKRGEILVTSFTTPEFVVVMKKSAGIVTDMGGVTSHSSIVARELNIPCVVGTKFATKLIKDGDVVEIDAGNGKVRIIK